MRDDIIEISSKRGQEKAGAVLTHNTEWDGPGLFYGCFLPLSDKGLFKK
jgi:hypothetical protein